MAAIHILQKKFGSSGLFGNEKDQSFHSSINTIYQTFDGKELYPSIEEKAAMLFYLVVKNHSFSDGNKRIAAFLFLFQLLRGNEDNFSNIFGGDINSGDFYTGAYSRIANEYGNRAGIDWRR